MPMNQESVWRRLMEVGPFASEDEARRAFEATLRALRRGLNEDEADWLAVALGPALSEPLLRESYAGDLPKEELYRWMKRYTKVRKGIAVEYAQLVCRMLAEQLPDADLERLKRHLPQLAFLFTRPLPGEPFLPRQRRQRTDRADHSLAGGRPGSSHALSDSAPPSAHEHSVARMRDPHGGARGYSSTSHGSVRH